MKVRTGNVRRQRPAPMRQKLCSALLLALATCAAPAWAQRNDAPQAYSISAGDLASALDQLASQSKVQIIYPAELVRGKRAPAVSGQQTWREALQKLLADTDLAWGFVNDTTVVIRQGTTSTVPQPQAATRNSSTLAQSGESEVQELERLTVTGTRIRGGTSASPTIVIGEQQFQQEGFTDLGEVIRSVPQNFTGGQNPGVLMGNVAGGGPANQNLTGGSGLNLRGLGPDASLTLLNGRRMSYGGFVQAVDISAIPVEAVERIEIVTDGSSAIYGSDAVGGVGNVILKRDFEGSTLGARYGTATDGGLTTREYTVTAGTTWMSGGLIATYKDVSTDPIYAHERDYTDHLPEPSTIYPGSDLRSGLISAYQWFGDAAELQLDVLRTERNQNYYYYFGIPSPYNVLKPETTTSFFSPTIAFSLPKDWILSIGGAWGKDEFIEDHSRVDVGTGVVTPYLNSCYCNESYTYEVSAEGPLFEMGGGDARLAVGAGYRKNEFLQVNYITNATAIQGDEGSRFAYAEINLPLIGATSGSARTQRLEMTAAARSEDYDSFGRVTTPKLGLIYGPSADFTVKASWGKSFKAPTLVQRNQAITALLRLPAQHGGVDYASDDRVLAFTGGAPDLEPEHARTKSASLAFHPENLPGLEAELTWFDIDYTDRVVQPVANAAEAMSNPNYAEFVDYSPTAERQAELLALARTFLNSTGVPYDPERVVAILDLRYVNATRQRIKGIDLSGSYRFGLGSGQLTIRGSTSWLDSTQQTAGTPSPYDLAGTLHNPAKVNSRVGAVWNSGGFSVSTFANYVGGVTNPSDGLKGASFTTVDATLRYHTTEGGGLWSGLEFALSANNLFDRAPPLYLPNAAAYVAPYDSTSYSAVGRFLSVSVSKRW